MEQDLKELLAENHLLEDTPPPSDAGIQEDNPRSAVAAKPPTPTPSELQQQRRNWRDEVAKGKCDDTQSVFDLNLLIQQREATQELIQAEKNFLVAKQHARGLGVFFTDYDQESQLQDLGDGWSKDAEVDEWNSRPIDLSDSVSVVAESKEKRRIDRWRLMCEQMALETQRKIKGEGE
ncbi:hypothetical protein G7Y89_g3189 [Cudoniella acicularis]|uniref:Uncharacterized protein n=1 Tax=Cudoniella acicularis TaxID=354080 RepID=A0A8H4RTS2_9HELO|nr:hypothetical protein G7Y89_g3189 [Cudoniella acicularis]